MTNVKKLSGYLIIILSWALVAVMLLDQRLLTLNNRLLFVLFLLISMAGGACRAYIANKRKLQYNLQELEALNELQWTDYVLTLYKMSGHKAYLAPPLPGEKTSSRLIVQDQTGKQIVWCAYYQKAVTAADLKQMIGTLSYFHVQKATFISREHVNEEDQLLIEAHGITRIGQEELFALREEAQAAFKPVTLKAADECIQHFNRIEKPVAERLSPLAFKCYVTQLAQPYKVEPVKSMVNCEIPFVLEKGQKRYGLCPYSAEESINEAVLYGLIASKPFAKVENLIVVTALPLEKAQYKYCKRNHIKVFSPLFFKQFCQLEKLKGGPLKNRGGKEDL